MEPIWSAKISNLDTNTGISVRYLLLILCVYFVSGLPADVSAQNGINWITFEEAEKLNATNPKPMFVDMYTDWCGWCKRLDQTTFRDPQIVQYFNRHFYAVKFDAEGSDTINFQGKTYMKPNPANKRSTHPLAVELFNKNRASYPTMVFLNENFKQRFIIQSYLPAKDLAPYLVFCNEKIYKSAPAQSFKEKFDKTFDTASVAFDWMTFDAAVEKQKKQPKKHLVFITTPGCVSCKIMDHQVFNDPKMASYIKEKYYPIKLDATEKETIKYLDKEFSNSPNHPYHDLALGLMKNSVQVPFVAIFNEKMEYIAPVGQYMEGKHFEAIMNYFGDDIYKNQSWDEYRKAMTKESASQ